jgi:ABC-type nitrate/sulfonate/bicarbonate transport system permease component
MENIKKKTTFSTEKKNQRKQDQYLKVASLIGFFIAWEILGWLNLNTDVVTIKYLPVPSGIFRSFFILWQDGTLLPHLTVSLQRVASGFIFGVLISIIIGSVIASSRLSDNVLSPIITLLGPIPVMAFLPMFILWFGMSESSRIALIVYATVMGMVSYVIQGIRDTDSTLIRSAMSLGANKLQVFWYVKFQSALPNIFEGIKGALGTTFGALTVAEMLGATKGLGFLIVFQKNWFKINEMVMTAILIGLLFTFFSGGIVLIERGIISWKYKAIGHAVE